MASSADDHMDNSNAWSLAHDVDDSSFNLTQPEYTGDDIHWGCAARRQQKCPNKGNWLLRFSTKENREILKTLITSMTFKFFYYLRVLSICISCVWIWLSTSSKDNLADAINSKLGPLKINSNIVNITTLNNNWGVQ